MERILILLGFWLAVSTSVLAQDQQYTQFYAVPTLLNPAFAGASAQSRLGMLYREQWSVIPGGFSSYRTTYDQYLPSINCGLGIIAGSEKAGSGGLQTSSLQLQMAYEVKIKRGVFFRPAMQLGYVARSIDFNKLLFYDQMVRGGNVSTLEDVSFGPTRYFDASGGALIYSSKYWFGFSAYHLNRPNEAVFAVANERVPVRYSAHGGYRLRIKNVLNPKASKELVFAANYQSQDKFDQLDLGFYTELNPVIVGVWYRGLPVKSNHYQHPNRDMMSLLLGFQWGSYKLGYSYDITTSQLAIGNTGGSHELSITYVWANKRNARKSKRRVIPCAKF